MNWALVRSDYWCNGNWLLCTQPTGRPGASVNCQGHLPTDALNSQVIYWTFRFSLVELWWKVTQQITGYSTWPYCLSQEQLDTLIIQALWKQCNWIRNMNYCNYIMCSRLHSKFFFLTYLLFFPRERKSDGTSFPHINKYILYTSDGYSDKRPWTLSLRTFICGNKK